MRRTPWHPTRKKNCIFFRLLRLAERTQTGEPDETVMALSELLALMSGAVGEVTFTPSQPAIRAINHQKALPLFSQLS